ncbi:MAG: phosphatase PAP2 family protein, partial [Candidatus Kapabacteria bacterium]|nr:phosphatase PAP2 family protein [Candidatus Kapabacteria bacterium]
MLEILQSVDAWLFYAVNHGWSNPVLDIVMPVVTNNLVWLPVFVIGIGWLLVAGKVKGRLCAFAMLICVLVSDPFNSKVLKEQIGRPRPYNTLRDVRVLVERSAGKSMPSSHATNIMGAAMILTLTYPGRWYWWYGVASLISLSRVYVGVHYPFDL